MSVDTLSNLIVILYSTGARLKMHTAALGKKEKCEHIPSCVDTMGYVPKRS